MATARETDLVTVAAVRTGDRKTVEYLFNERQRIYVLADRTAADDQSARRLKAALAKKRPIKVALNAKRGTIERVSEPTGRELFAGVMVYRRHDPKKLVLCMSGKRSGQTNVKGGLTIYRAALGPRWVALDRGGVS